MTIFVDEEGIAEALNEDYYAGERVLISWHGTHASFGRNDETPQLRYGQAIVTAIRPHGRPWTRQEVHSAILDAAKDWPEPTLDDMATELNWRAMRGINFAVSRTGIGRQLAAGTYPDTLMRDEAVVSSRRDDGEPWTGKLLAAELKTQGV